MASRVELMRSVNQTDLYQEVIPRLAAADTPSHEAIDIIHQTAMYSISAVHLDGILTRRGITASLSSLQLGGLRRNVDMTRALGDYAVTIKGRTQDAATGQRFEVVVPAVTAARVNGLLEQITTKTDQMVAAATTERDTTRAAAWGNALVSLLQPYYDGNKGAARGLYSLAKQRAGMGQVRLEQPKDAAGNVPHGLVANHSIHAMIDLYRIYPNLLPPYLPYDRTITPRDILGVPDYVPHDVWVPAKKESLFALLSTHATEIDHSRLSEIISDDTVDQYRRVEQSAPILR